MPSSEGQLAILDALSEPAFVVDGASLRIVSVNRRALREFGIASAEWQGRFLPELAGNALLSETLTASNGDPLSVLVSLPSRGESREGKLTFCHFSDQGKTYGLCTFKSAPLSANPSSGDLSVRLRKLFDHSHDLIFTSDVEGKFTSINPAGLKAFGYASHEIVGQSLTFVADRDLLRQAMEKYKFLYDSGKPTPSFELRCYRRNRETIWIELSVLHLIENGRDLGTLGMGRDITERKRAEQAVLDSQQRLKEQQTVLSRVIDQNPYAIALWNTNGELRQCNNAFVRLIGTVPGAGYNLLRDPQAVEAGVQDAFARALEGETVFLERAKYDVGLNPKSGAPSKPVRFSFILFPVVDANDRPIHMVTIFQDLAREIEERAARELLEAQLRHAQKMEAIGTLAGGVAHDFNNLLTGVIGYLDMIRAETAPEIHAYVNKAEKAAQRACELTRQLLAYARKNRMEIIAHDLNTTLTEVSMLVEKTIDSRVAIQIEPSPEPVTVLADPGQMNQVLMNLTINARDAVKERLDAEPDNSNWRARIRVRNRRVFIPEGQRRNNPNARSGWFCCLSVADTGTGMEPATRSRIFDPFFTTKPIGRGTGLGLATIFGIVSQHEGWIDVLSKPGKGSSFKVYLPLIDADPERPSDAAVSVRVPGGDETILLVDDEETILDLCRDILEGKGYQVLLAPDGARAVELFERHHDKIDLVLLDLAMPRLSGKKVIPRLQAIDATVPIVASSGYSSENETRTLLQTGASAFVEKPYHAFDLLRVVRNVLDGE